jgi:glycosyltransferase involved in cell wall biosynthesis
MLVKNEADIVRAVIIDAVRWADRIFILDNGSTDGTWEIVRSLKGAQVVPWKQDFRPYTNGMRADVFNAFRHESEPGDWWCFKLDADEFYVENPRTFLQTVPARYQLVSKKSLDYFITEEDLQEYEFTGDFEKDLPKLKYIRTDCWSEPRFFRYRKGLNWKNEPENHYPPHIGVLSPDFILVKHYQYRSPKQMQARLDLRNGLSSKKRGGAFRHVKQTDWHELVKRRSELAYDDGHLETYKELPVRNNLKQSWVKKQFLRMGIALGVYR